MRGLTLWQPYASLLALGHKWIETRSWYTSYRGPVLIHAAASASMPYRLAIAPELADILRALGLPEDGGGLPMGKVLAIADLANCCHSTGEGAWPVDQRAMGDLSRGRLAWIFRDIRPLDRPVAWRGAQGLWDGRPFLESCPDLAGAEFWDRDPLAPPDAAPRLVQGSLFGSGGLAR